jgi:hypothetical protein
MLLAAATSDPVVAVHPAITWAWIDLQSPSITWDCSCPFGSICTLLVLRYHCVSEHLGNLFCLIAGPPSPRLVGTDPHWLHAAAAVEREPISWAFAFHRLNLARGPGHPIWELL